MGKTISTNANKVLSNMFGDNYQEEVKKNNETIKNAPKVSTKTTTINNNVTTPSISSTPSFTNYMQSQQNKLKTPQTKQLESLSINNKLASAPTTNNNTQYKGTQDAVTGTASYLLNPLINAGTGIAKGVVDLASLGVNALGTVTGSEAIKNVGSGIDNLSSKMGGYINENVQETENDPVSHKLTELAPSIGQNTATAVISGGTSPLIGATTFGLSAAGGYRQEGLNNRNMDEKQALLYGLGGGALEMGSELISLGTLNSGLQNLAKGQIKKAVINAGVNLAEEYAQEAVTELGQEGLSQALGGTYSYDNMLSRMNQAGIDGALSALILQGSGAGMVTCSNVVNKIQNNQQLTTNDITKAENDLKKVAKVEKQVEDNDTVSQTWQNATDLSKLIAENSQIANNINSKPLLNNTDIITQNKNENTLKNDLNNQKISDVSDLAKFSIDKKENVKINSAIQKLAKKLGVEIQFEELNDNVNAKIEGNKITVNSKIGDVASPVVMHELTHRMQELNNQKFGVENKENLYNKYKDFIADTISNDQHGTFDKMMTKYENIYNKQNGQGLNSSEITDEMVADFTGEMFSGNTELIEQLATRDRTLFEKIVDTLKEILSDVKNTVGLGDSKTVNIKGFDVSMLESNITKAENLLKSMNENIGVKEEINDINSKLKKSNIKVKENVYKRYTTAVEILNSEDGEKINIIDGNIENISDIKNMNVEELKKEAIKIYKNNNSGFSNYEDYKISISNAGINEIIQKIYYNNALHNKLNENLLIIKNLDTIFKNSKLVSQNKESLGHGKHRDYNTLWNYFVSTCDINGERYSVLFDVVSQDNGNNNLRVQRIQKKEISQSDFNNSYIIKNSPNEKSQYNNSISQNTNNVNSDTKFSLRNFDIKNDNVRYSLNEKQKSFPKTANESNILNMENSQTLAEQREENGTYKVKSNKETLSEAQKYIDSMEGTSQKEKLDNALQKFSDNLIDTGISSAVATELVKQYQEIGESKKAVDLIWNMDEKLREQGRNIQYINTWKALQPEGKITWLKRAVENYNKDHDKKINFNEKTAGALLERFEKLQTLANLQNDSNKKNIEDALKKELIANGRYNTKLEKNLAQSTLNSVDLSIDELKEKVMSENIMQVLNQGETSTWKKVATYQTIAHLVNSSTAGRNLLSNEAMWTMDKIARKFAGGIEKLMTGRNIIGMSLDKEQKQNVKTSSKEESKKVMLDILLGIDGLEGVKYNNSGTKKIQGIISTFKNPMLNSLEKVLGVELKVPDENMKSKVRTTIKEQYKKALGDDYVKYENEINDYADQEALYITFQDETFIATEMQKLKEMFNKIGFNDGEFGLGDLLIKYTQVPGNLVSRTIEYSPIGAVKGLAGMIKAESSARKGKISITERNKAYLDLARGLTGTSLMTLGLVLAQSGMITGNKDDDDYLTKLLKQAGVSDGEINMSQIYRLISGNNTGNLVEDKDLLLSFDWLQPTSMIISSGAVLYNDVKHQRNLGQTTTDILENMLDLPCNQSLSTIMQAYQYGYGDAEANSGTAVLYGVLQAGGDSLAGFIPSISRHIANAVDPTSRNTYTRGNIATQTAKKVLNNIPFASKLVEPNINANGEEKQAFNGGTLLNFINQAAPGRMTATNLIEGTQKIKEVMKTSDGESLAKKSNMPLSYAPNKTSYEKDSDGNKITLTDKQKTEYMKAYAKYYKDNYVSYLNKNVSDNLTDEKKEKIAKELQSINTAAKKYAEKQALQIQ